MLSADHLPRLGKPLKPGEGVVNVISVTASVGKWSAIAERDRNGLNAGR
jgi:hypothetical protein